MRTRFTLRLAATLLAAGCADVSESGLHVDGVDAAFGFARSAVQRPSAAADAAFASNAMNNAGADAGDAPLAASDAAALPGALDAGPPAPVCRNLAAFTANVTPLVVERCVRCHDGTKSKATKTLDLTSARETTASAQQLACNEMLQDAPNASEMSPIFAEVNPGDTSTVHDFKYPSSAAYMAYRMAVLAWLESELAK